MGKILRISPKARLVYAILILFFLGLFVAAGILSVRYYTHVQETVSAESNEYMQEISAQMGTNVRRTLHDNFSVLSSFGLVFTDMKASRFEELQPIISSILPRWDYEDLYLIGEDGYAIDGKGETLFLGGADFLQQVIVGRKNSVSASQMIVGEERIIFAAPIPALMLGEMKILAIAGSYSLSTFDKILSMSAFSGQGYAHIIRADGTVVVRSSAENALPMGFNVLSTLANAKIDRGQTVEGVAADIAAGRGGQISFSLGTARESMTYTALGTQGWTLLNFVPLSVINAKSDVLLHATLLLCGFFVLSFALLLLFIVGSSLLNRHQLERIAFVDPITGGNTIQHFYVLAQRLLSASGDAQYALIYLNISKFKLLNEQFGRSACDALLRGIEHSVGAELSGDECLGRLFADNYCVLVRYTDQKTLAQRLTAWYAGTTTYTERGVIAWLPMLMECGVYVIEDGGMPFPLMVDRAKLALLEDAGQLHGKLRMALYSEPVRRVLLREKHLEDRMEDALEQGEFQVYLQPKYKTQNEEIGGAEALIRWLSPDEGMIYPDEFIPLFEKNGFVTQVDFWIFEEVCRTLRRWLDLGLAPVKISVNCSRVHLKNADFIATYCEILARYDLPAALIEIELTENTVFGDVDYLTQMIEKIRSVGFGCSMDDFGSGYSSLNLLRNIPVDTIKLDRVFFHTTERDSARTESIVASIITMTKALSITTVAEGVEQREQLDMLKRLGCDYIQGFYFAKPMPLPQFETLLFGAPSCSQPAVPVPAPTQGE